MPAIEPLKFRVAPHIVQDLGLNLYTSLPRVLVEFIANAYDADSPSASIEFDKERVDKERKLVKSAWELEKAQAEAAKAPIPSLSGKTLPDDLKIVITDAGHGMTRDDLKNKFLVAGRRRRGADNQNCRSEKGRILMGRKGLGKLAGFGVAKIVTIITRFIGESHATEICLNYDDLLAVSDTNGIPIKETKIKNDDLFVKSGTQIILSSLLYEPLGAMISTIENKAADHFTQINKDDFSILLNGKIVEPTPREIVYAWPKPDLPLEDMVSHSLKLDGQEVQFEYRMRFVADKQALIAKNRGVRVYAHNRLAAAPSLLEADTNMHGFRMTDYLDGVICADFIDDQPEDYVATDRQSLRWESPLLAPLQDFLSAQIKSACYERQKVRDAEKAALVRQDVFTTETIGKASLTKRETSAAFRIAAAVSTMHKKGYDDDEYKTQLTEVIDALGRGELISTLADLAKQANPELDRVIAEVTRLTGEQLDGYHKYVKSRIDGIEALRKIVTSADFKEGKNEQRLHDLFNKNAWLIDPAFFEFFTSEKTEKTAFTLLEKELHIGSHTKDGYDPDAKSETKPGGSNKRPDLVFVLGSSEMSRVVIVELKAPNTPLYGDHYRQLQGYVRRTKKWLKKRGKASKVEGLLIGSLANIESKAEEVEWLNEEIENTKNQGECRVFGIDQVLENTQQAHRELMDMWEKQQAGD